MSENKAQKSSLLFEKAKVAKYQEKLTEILDSLDKDGYPVSSKTKKPTWYKKDLFVRKGVNAQLVITTEGSPRLNLRVGGERYGMFLHTFNAFKDFMEILENQKIAIGSLLKAIESNSGSTSSAESLDFEL